MFTKKQREKILEIRQQRLSSTIIGAVVGTVLGDGCLQKIRSGNYCYLKLGQKSKQYLQYKVQVLRPIFLDKEIMVWRDRVTGNKNFHLNSVSHSDLYEIWKLMYKDGRKVVTKEILDKLTIFGFALWFFDDGYFNKKSGGYFLSTCAFTLEEQKLIREYLFKKLGLYTTILRNQKWWKLYFAKRTRERLEDYLITYAPPCMQYKIRDPQRLYVKQLKKLMI